MSGVQKLTDGNWVAPFWGAEKSFITGQDMLGMQNTSIATYGTLLPGLTNLTRHIRYYGFYTWMLEQYAHTIGKVSISEFQRFMRRGELLLAFVMSHAFPNDQGVVGSQFAKKYLLDHSDVVDLSWGADRNQGHRTYWKYSTGAFGQYYQGSLIAIGLIAPQERDDRLSVCTPTLGRTLARHFGSTIPKQICERYLLAIENGAANVQDLVDFAPYFSLAGIIPHSDEWRFYIDLLFGPDNPLAVIPDGHCFFRKETMLLYLEFLNNAKLHAPKGRFPESFYTNKWQVKPFIDFEAKPGWYYYAVNEYAHFALETLLSTLLSTLNAQGPMQLSAVLKYYTDSTCLAICKYFTDFGPVQTTFETFSQVVSASGVVPSHFSDQIEKKKAETDFEAVAHALGMLGQIYRQNHGRIADLKKYTRTHDMSRDGDVVELIEWLDRNKHLSLDQLVERLLLQNIINRHIEVAMRKMRSRNENTLKFQFEDNTLKPIDVVGPVWTGPRISSLHQFLVDLKLVDTVRSLTPLGQSTLEGYLQ